MTCHNWIVSSQANDYFAHNSPSQFKCRRPDNLLLDQELDWSMALKGCSIPNRFNTITSDGTCSITVKKILFRPGDDSDQLDEGEVTVYIKPGCYLTADSLAEAITKSFTESDLPLECTLVSKVVELSRLRGSGGPKTYPVISNSSSSVVALMLKTLSKMLSTSETLLADDYSDCEAAVGDVVDLIRRAGKTADADVRLNVRLLDSPLLAIRETPANDNDDGDDDDDNDDNNDERKYFIDISPALAAICEFAPCPLTPMNVSLFPVMSGEGLLNVTTSYPKQFLLCSDALQKSYIVKSGDFDPQRLLYHFTAPDPRKHALIKIGHGIGHDIPLTHLKFSSLHFSMCDLDGRQLEIDSKNLTWLDLRLSSARK